MHFHALGSLAAWTHARACPGRARGSHCFSGWSSDRVAVLSGGGILQCGTAGTVFHQPADRAGSDVSVMVRPHEVTGAAPRHGAARVIDRDFRGGCVRYSLARGSGTVQPHIVQRYTGDRRERPGPIAASNGEALTTQLHAIRDVVRAERRSPPTEQLTGRDAVVGLRNFFSRRPRSSSADPPWAHVVVRKPAMQGGVMSCP